MRVWLVIPVFDEAATVANVVRGARAHGPVLVVDDGSRDASAAAARAAGAHVLRHAARRGKGAALRTGIEEARRRGATHVVTLDGDGQHDPDDVPALLAVARETRHTIVVGSRLVRALPAGEGLGGARLNALLVAAFFSNWASGVSVGDTQSGFRVYPADLFDELRLRRGGFVFETEVVIAAATRGWPVREVPVRVIPRAARRSRFRPVADGVAIGAYLAGQAVRRWAGEAGAALGEVGCVLAPERRRARHAEMLAAGVLASGNPATWGVALTAVAARRAGRRITTWWRHPRRQRATVAAQAALASPLLLALALAQGVAGPRMPDLVTPLVRRLYSQARLDAPLERAAVDRRGVPVAGRVG